MRRALLVLFISLNFINVHLLAEEFILVDVGPVQMNACFDNYSSSSSITGAIILRDTQIDEHKVITPNSIVILDKAGKEYSPKQLNILLSEGGDPTISSEKGTGSGCVTDSHMNGYKLNRGEGVGRAVFYIKDDSMWLIESNNPIYIGLFFDGPANVFDRIRIFGQTINLKPLPELSRETQIRFFNNRGDYSLALEKAKSLVSENPADAKSVALLAGVLANTNNKEEAVRNFTKAIQLDPTNKNHTLMRAHVYVQMKQYENALIDLNELIKNDVTNKTYFVTKANILEEMGQYENAVDMMECAVKLDPKNKSYRQYRKILKGKVKKQSKARVK